MYIFSSYIVHCIYFEKTILIFHSNHILFRYNGLMHMVDLFPSLLSLTQVKVKFFFYYFKTWQYTRLLNFVVNRIWSLITLKSQFLRNKDNIFTLQLGSKRKKNLLFLWKIEKFTFQTKGRKMTKRLSWLILVFVACEKGKRIKRFASMSDRWNWDLIPGKLFIPAVAWSWTEPGVEL